ncbi:hypothetical protein EG68_02989 [Paragonimus skrjabini miyazakii]|uniref:Delta-like protein n=1 Tax=Paragonimus skrjabini miyazakii TaxID=59628 RepID=A0A8S9YXJ7_9TREM|nr:hypothetical protein EG68_02989 [Paragonimus skrjabini miyazakii]
MFRTNSLMLLLLLYIFLNSSSDVIGEELLFRSHLDIKIQSVRLPDLRNSTDIGPHKAPFVENCCDELDDRKDGASCVLHCRLLIGVCLSKRRQQTDSLQTLTNPVNVTVAMRPKDALGPVEHWRRIRYQEVNAYVIPDTCDSEPDLLRTDILTNGREFIGSHRVYRVKITTVPLHGLSIRLTLYHETLKGELNIIDRLQRFISQLKPDNTWTTEEMVSQPWHSEQWVVGQSDSPTVSNTTDPFNKSAFVPSSHYSLIMLYKFGCHKNYFGNTCNRFCKAHNSVLGHYKCDPQTGAMICNTGWTGTRCDEAICKKGCIHGVCEKPGLCSCMDGWEGSTCNECVSLPGCIHGQCKFNMNLADWEPYTCHCSPGWSGMLCNIDTQYCVRHPMICQNGGKCLNSTDPFGSLPPYTCACAPGFRGTHCEHQIRNCDYHGCNGIGTCQPSGECICPPGHYGSRCQFNQTECNQNPCIGQHSTCVQQSEAILSAGLPPPAIDSNAQNATGHPRWQHITFECHCERGRFGENCEYETNVCDTMQPCLNGGRCVSLGNGYQCVCPTKFTGDHCQLTVSACHALSCANGGECLDGATRFTCHCPFGWTGPTCRENVNECAEVPRLTGRALCEHGAGCRDLPGSYQCLCPTEWTGTRCELPTNHTDNKQRESQRNETTDTKVIDVVHTRSGKQLILLMVILGTAVPVTGAILISGIILLINNCRSYGKERREYYTAKQTKFSTCSNEEPNATLYETARVKIDRNLGNSVTLTNADNEVEANKSVLCVHHHLPVFSGKSGTCLTEKPLNPDSKSTTISDDPTQLSSDFLKLTTIRSQPFAQSISLSDNTVSLSDTSFIDRIATKNQYRATVCPDTPPPSYEELQWTIL